MKLSDFKGEEAIEVFADLMEPVAKILADGEILDCIKKEMPKVAIIKKIMKNHPHEIVEVMAILDKADPETYEVNLFSIPIKLTEILADEAVTSLFTSQGRKEDKASSGSAMANTEE